CEWRRIEVDALGWWSRAWKCCF
ncbi:MAG: hypothetical protein AVDCRST_MAG86-96, partial [uncultured Truepera sp.]